MSELSIDEPDEARADMPTSLFARVWELYEQGKLVAACAWCGRIRLDNRWLEPPSSVIAAIDGRNMFSHSICEKCSQAVSPPGATP